ncbi:MAG: hypothetical protein NTW80_09935, partial [Deltaproteobacteria bacterium]|nr:hypothetical protein [Deltaproteobacteria bacterium]
LYQGGNLLGKINANGGTKFYLGDGFNSLRFSSDTQGNITGTKDLPPLGEPLGQKGGEIFLPEIKTSLVNGRVYEADSGRFPTPNTTGDNYASNSNLGFWRALQRGAFLGTRFGEEAAEYWAQKQLATGNWGYAIPGVFASLWTPETWFDTATTLGGQAIMGGIEAATGKFLPRLIQTKSAFKVNLTRNIPLEIKTSPGRHTGNGEKEAGGALHAAVKIADVHPHF